MTPELKQRIQDYLATNPPGWCWEAKALALAESALVTHAPVCVEIGVFGGRSLIPIAMAADAVVLGIDPWSREAALTNLDPIKDAAHIKWWSALNLEDVMGFAQTAIQAHGLEHKCFLLRARGSQVLPMFEPGQLLFLHIDGCHEEAVALDDVQMWLPRCRSGAHIWMDDTNWTSTQKAVRFLEYACSHASTIPDPATGSECRLFIKH